jgi:NADPH:quinone reductase-like Zn-dependent oxidoreductase
MKALVYEKAHSLADFAIKLVEIPVPTPRENDVLVDARAIGVNPGEAAIRSMRGAEPGGRVLLGWEFAGVVSAVGAAVARFKVGDRVFGAGDMTRDSSWNARDCPQSSRRWRHRPSALPLSRMVGHDAVLAVCQGLFSFAPHARHLASGPRHRPRLPPRLSGFR